MAHIVIKYDILDGTRLTYPRSLTFQPEEVSRMGVFTKRVFNDRSNAMTTESAFYFRYKNHVYGVLDASADYLDTVAGDVTYFDVVNRLGETPISYPLGIVINDVVIGNAATPKEYCDKFNAVAANAALGTLYPTDNPFRFRFAKPLASKSYPSQLIGMRYFQFDWQAASLNSMTTPDFSYVDLGNGVQLNFTSGGVFPAGVTNYGYGWDTNFGGLVTKCYRFVYNYGSTGNRTVYIYHNDKGYWISNDNQGSPSPWRTSGTNLKGNLPLGFSGIEWTCVGSATFNSFANVNQKEWKNNFWNWQIRSGDFGTATENESWTPDELDFPNLLRFDIMNENYVPNFVGKTIDQIIGTNDLTKKYPKLGTFYLRTHLWKTGFKFLMPSIEWTAILNGAGIGASETDRLCNEYWEIRKSMPSVGGNWFRIGSGAGRTAASDAAVAGLIAKGFWVQIV